MLEQIIAIEDEKLSDELLLRFGFRGTRIRRNGFWKAWSLDPSKNTIQGFYNFGLRLIPNLEGEGEGYVFGDFNSSFLYTVNELKIFWFLTTREELELDK